MAYEPRPNSGTLFKNDKQGNDKAPDYKGDLCLPTGEVIKIAGWIKQGAKGPFMSLSIDKPRAASSDADDGFRGPRDEPVARRDDRNAPDPFDDSIPF